MKILFFSILFLSFSATSQTIKLKDYNYIIPDISKKRLTKEVLYQKMNRSLVRSKDSICSNRAHVWSWDFKIHDIEAPKIFLFFTSKTANFGGASWWYHASPLVNQDGKLWVMDAGYPQKVSSPLSVQAWLKTFNGEDSRCKEIKHSDADLIERMFTRSAFPQKTDHGKYDCYYKITPPGYWTPTHVAKNLLGKDEHGRPVHFERDVMDEGEVYQACLEAATTPLGWVARTARRRCNYFLNHGSLKI